MRTRSFFRAVWIGIGVFSALLAAPAHALQLLSNGDFELGSLADWRTVEQPGGSGKFYAASDIFAPVSGLTTAGPAGGKFYAVSDSSGYGAQALLQTFTIPTNSASVVLSFDMFVNDWSGAGPIINPAGLDYSSGPNQYARVDILSANASALDTGSGVVQNLYQGVDAPGSPPPNDYTHYVFDLTSSLGGGGTYQIRFADVNTEFFLNQGIDNVSITVTAIPEPSLLWGSMMGAGLAVSSFLFRRRASLTTKSATPAPSS